MVFLKNKTTSYSELADNDLVFALVQEKDQAIRRQMQETLYDRYAEKVFAKCMAMVRNRDLAKDLSHDIIVKIFLNLNKFRGDSPFYGWVYAVAYNHCLTYLKNKKRLKIEDFEAHSYDIATDEDELEAKQTKEVQLSHLEKLMNMITEPERLILLMRYQDSMSVKQIADLLGIGESAVKMRLKRSRDHLAELLKDSGDEE